MTWDLTARENIFLNGAVLGYDKPFMQSHFDEIMDFAELWGLHRRPGQKLFFRYDRAAGIRNRDDRTGRYSDRDEILAVGDIAFQRKCHQRMADMLKSGTTLILVSHNMEDVQRLCQKVVWLQDGQVRQIGPTAEICPLYIEA